MKKIIVLLSFVFTVGLSFGQDLASVVKNMPDDLILKIEPNQKDKLSGNISDTTTVIVTNVLGETVERVAVSDDYIALKTSDAGLLQIKLLPLINNSYIIAVVKTVCGKACDSSINFYTTDWQPLTQTGLIPEKNKDLFLKKDIDLSSDVYQNASAPLDMTPVKYQLNPTNTDLQAIYDIKGYLAAPDYDLLKPFLENEEIVLKWDKTAYAN